MGYAVPLILQWLTGGRSRGSSGFGPPLLKLEKCNKNLLRKKFIAITGTRSISCLELTLKYLVGIGRGRMNISKIIFFNWKQIRSKLDSSCLFYNLLACNKKAEILPSGSHPHCPFMQPV